MERLLRLLDASTAYEQELTSTITVTMAMMMPTIEPPEPLTGPPPPPRWPPQRRHISSLRWWH